MKIKLDENIGRRGVELLKLAGHDEMTVRYQNLQGARDEVLFDVCAAEDRVLITLDHDFGQVLRFPPERGSGSVILEPGGRATPQSLLDRLRDFLLWPPFNPRKGLYGLWSRAVFVFICATGIDIAVQQYHVSVPRTLRFETLKPVRERARDRESFEDCPSLPVDGIETVRR